MSDFYTNFSSTETYANRYDLDEIDVFLEGDSNNPMFFNVEGLPKFLNYGKHYFNLSILDSTRQQYRLKPNSRILFEFKSANNVILKSDISEINQKNGVIVGFVEVLQNPLRTSKEISDGYGTLTIVGSIENKPPLPANPNSKRLIPEKFRGAMNYRCVFPIEVRKNLMNANSSSPIALEHKLTTTYGLFSFAKINISAKGSDGITYDSEGSPNVGISTNPSHHLTS